MGKILVTGASGFLGYHLLQAMEGKCTAFCQYHQQPILQPTPNKFAIDLTRQNEIESFFSNNKVDAIIHAAAISDSNFCENNKAISYQLNVWASEFLAQLAKELRIPFVFTSTDLVFDGKKGNYSESVAPSPLMEYGRQKVLAEEKIIAANENSLIVRLPLLYGAVQASQKNNFSQTIAKLKNNEKIFLFEDEYRTMADGFSVANGILDLLFTQKGIFHLGGKERLSRYQFGMCIKEVFDFDEYLFVKTKQSELKMAAARPADVSLNSSKAFAAGYHPLGIKEALLHIKNLSPQIN